MATIRNTLISQKPKIGTFWASVDGLGLSLLPEVYIKTKTEASHAVQHTGSMMISSALVDKHL